MASPDIFGDGRRPEGLTSLDRLRGPNSTLQLAQLIENFVRDTATAVAEGEFNPTDRPTVTNRLFNSKIVSPIELLQGWAQSIDQEITKAAIAAPPKLRSSLEYRVGQMIQEGVISDDLDLIRRDSKSPPAVLSGAAPHHQHWHLIKALFNIDTADGLWIRDLSPWHKGHFLVVPNFYAIVGLRTIDLGTIYDRMFDLISSKTQEKGGLKDITPPHEVPQDVLCLSYRKVHLAPTVINGVSAIISTHAAIRSGELDKYISDGIPYIYALTLELSPSFLTSVRPLTQEQYRRYVPEPEPKHEPKQEEKQEQRQSTGSEGRQKAGFGFGSGERQNTRGYESPQKKVDPRDPQGYYKTLGVNPDADPEDLEELMSAAYRRLAYKYHPDRGGDTSRMKALNLAYEFLSKPENRRVYGNTL